MECMRSFFALCLYSIKNLTSPYIKWCRIFSCSKTLNINPYNVFVSLFEIFLRHVFRGPGMSIPLREVKFITQRHIVDAISDLAEVFVGFEQARRIEFQVAAGVMSYQSKVWYTSVV